MPAPYRSTRVPHTPLTCLWSVLAVVGVLLVPRLAIGQSPPRTWIPRHWTTSEGLPQNTVNDILVQPSGELWLATYGGIVRFDGLTFSTLDMVSVAELPSTRIVALEPDGADGTWAATQLGHIVHLRGEQVLNVRQLGGPEVNPVRAMAADGARGLWVCTAPGTVWRYDGSWYNLDVLPPPSSGGTADRCPSPASFVPAGDGGLWLAVGPQVERLAADGTVAARLTAPSDVTALAPTSDGRLWVGTERGIHAVDHGRVSPAPLAGLAESVRLIQSAGDTLTVATHRGVYRLDAGTHQWVAIARDHELDDAAATVMAMVGDRHNNLWLGMGGRGLIQLRRQPVAAFGSGGVVAITGDGRGGATVAMACRELFDAGSDRLVQRPWAIAGCVTALHRDASGRLWVGTTRGLVDADGLRRLPPPLDRAVGVTAIAEDRQQRVWLAFADGHITSVTRSGGSTDVGIPTGVPRTIAFGPDGDLWIGTDDVLYRWHAGVLHQWDNKKGLPRGPIRAVLPLKDGSVWIATYGGGLGLLRDGAITRLPALPDNHLSGLLADGRGRLWILSNRGILVGAVDHLTAVATTRHRGLDVTVLGAEAGVAEGNFGGPAAYQDRSGRFWFSTIQQVVSISPEEFPSNRENPLAHVESIAADERPLDIRTAVVPAGAGRITIAFTSYQLTAPQRLAFRWRLDGADGDWSPPATRRAVSYTGLTPGRYTFRLLARNEDGVWSARETLLTFEVLPAWYQTWLARGAAAGLAAGLLVFGHRLRLRRVRERAQLLTREMQERVRAEEQVTRLRVQLEHVSRVTTAGELATSLAHEVNQPLAAIATNAQAARRYLGQPQPPLSLVVEILDDVVKQSQRASDVIQSLRAFLRKSPPRRDLVSLNDVVGDVLPLVDTDMRAHRVGLSLNLDPHLPAVSVDRIQVQQVVVNLLTNAREATEAVAEPREVSLRTYAVADSVRLACRDNGPGLPPSVAGQVFEPFVTTKPDGMGMGLAICRSLVDANGGHMWYEELDGGTVFVAEFPSVYAERT